MAYSSLTVTFNGSLLPEDVLRFQFVNVSSLLIKETIKVTRTGFGEVTNDTIAAANYAAALLLDYPDMFTIDIDSNVLILTSIIDGATFTPGVAVRGEDVLSEVDFEPANTISSGLTVTGIESDRYLINNEIWIEIDSSETVLYYKLVFQNQTNQKVSSNLIIYPNQTGFARVNIAPIIKSMFDYPDDQSNYITTGQVIRNANRFKISVSNADGEALEITKTFIRGGNRTNDTNQTLAAMATLRPSEKLPVWDGYDTADYVLSSGNTIIKKLLSEVSAINKDYRRAKGCNEIYAQFLNQKGGYSNWLFNTYEQSETGTGLGSFVRYNQISDFGADVDNKLKAYAKVPVEYIHTLKDLIISSEVYVYLFGVKTRVTIGKNAIVYDPQKRSYAVNINFDFQYRFNPSVLWSN